MNDLLDKFAQLLGAYSQAADDEIQAIEDDDFEAIREANDDRSEAAKELADFLLEHGPMVTFTDAAPEPTIAPDDPSSHFERRIDHATGLGQGWYPRTTGEGGDE